MCRIAGIFDTRKPQGLERQDILMLEEMCSSLAHGGPDGKGFFVEECLGLGHRRLAIIDLSDAGIQPMTFGKWTITFNGEIYNYQDIRFELQQLGYEFQTDSDTEVIVKSIDRWGYSAVKKFHGMFVFALWNSESRQLAICRDRVGVKPVYCYRQAGLFMFASELKAFHKHSDFDNEVNTQAVPHFLQKGYVHPTECIYKHVFKVAPGTILFVNEHLEFKTEVYWDIEAVYKNAILDNRSFEVVAEELESLLLKSFQLRMVSDVPVGIFLSGGIDSTLVTAMLQKNNQTPLKTFTIGFEDPKYNEAGIARCIAKTLGTEHTEITCTEEDFKRVLSILPQVYDEPFADNSAIPTLLVSSLAGKNVKVALSGDGADELFGGYSKYHFSRYSNGIINTPFAIRKGVSNIMAGISHKAVERIANAVGYKSVVQVGNKFHKLRQVMLANTRDDFFERSSSFLTPEQLDGLVGNVMRPYYYSDAMPLQERWFSYMGMRDIQSYLPGDILTKVDRASMSVSLEAREPFLDQDIIDFALRIPDKFKFHKKYKGKYLLKYILAKYIPEKIIRQPKSGFTIPVGDWMLTLLKDDILEMGDSASFAETFDLNQKMVQKFVNQFLAGRNDINPHAVWNILCLYKWYREWKVK